MRLLIILTLTVVNTTGCMHTSENTEQLATQIVETAESLHKHHDETIDAYILSMEAAQADIKALSTIIQKDQSQLTQLKKSLLLLRREALINQAITDYQNKAQEKVLSGLDQRIEDTFWPPIVAKQKVYRDKADQLKLDIENHPCSINISGCTSIATTNFKVILTQYRDYSVAAEYILHLGYEQETLIWQMAVEQYQQQLVTVKTKALETLAQQDNSLDISVDSLDTELLRVYNNIGETINTLKQEKIAINSQWQVTKNALSLLAQEVTQPAIWQLILDGASGQTKAILTSYSETIKDKVGGILGDTIGQISGDIFAQSINVIVDNATDELANEVSDSITQVTTKLDKEVDTFNQQQINK